MLCLSATGLKAQDKASLIVKQLVEEDSRFKEWKIQNIDALYCSEKHDFMTTDERDVVTLMNMARFNGALFASTFLNYYLEDKNLSLRNSKYVKSLIVDLNKTKGKAPFKVSRELYECASKHAIDMGKKGKTGHDSSKGESFSERMKKCVNDNVAMRGENCSYGMDTPIGIIMQLLIDENVSSLGHRKNILEEPFNTVGVAIEPHKKYGTNCVMDFARIIN
jgi:uncharacterized protein YkwD